MEDVGPCRRDVYPHEHVKMQCSSLLELESIEVCQDVCLAGLLGVSDVRLQAVAAATSEITPCYLL